MYLLTFCSGNKLSHLISRISEDSRSLAEQSSRLFLNTKCVVNNFVSNWYFSHRCVR